VATANTLSPIWAVKKAADKSNNMIAPTQPLSMALIISYKTSMTAVSVYTQIDRQAKDWLVGCLMASLSTQKGQFVPTAAEGNRLSRLGMANEIQCILPYVTR